VVFQSEALISETQFGHKPNIIILTKIAGLIDLLFFCVIINTHNTFTGDV